MASALTDRFHALLVGIDFYLPNKLADGSYPRLRGCVEDVRCVEEYLRQDLGIGEDRIERLTASYAGGTEPPEPRDRWPTYERMVAALQRLGESAQPGDQVLFYFSGHGGRTVTSWPKLKGERGLDECLVPVDIGDSQARYLRDVEIARFIRELSDRKLRFTLVLDCCHSGGGTKDMSSNQARGGSFVDTTARPAASLLASESELEIAWQELTRRGGTRDVAIGSGWLPEYSDFALMAACRASELAFEARFDGRTRGVFTYWWLDSLRRLGLGMTYKRLHDRVLAKVHSRYETQTPVLEGDGSRLIFGEETGRVQHAARVLRADPDRLLLNVGRVHGIAPGARFDVYPAGAENLDDPADRVARVEVTQEIDAAHCTARILERASPEEQLEDDGQAVLADLGEARLRRTVQCLEGSLTTQALESLRQEIEGSGFLELAGDDPGPDFRVASLDDEAVILDSEGRTLIHLGPRPEPGWILGRLEHLAKFRHIQQLSTPEDSGLRDQLVLELGHLPGGYRRGQRLTAADVVALPDPVVVPDRTYLCLTVRNSGRRRLNFVVIGLQPDGSITQKMPPLRYRPYLTLDAGDEQRIPFRLRFVPGAPNLDLLKVFATQDTTDYAWLELPRLGRPTALTPAVRAPLTRELVPRPAAAAEWVAEEVSYEIVENAPPLPA